jgi:hypothetical protein
MASMTTARADEIDKKTNITVNETILIPGRTLPPGKYVMKLANVTANRHVVQIFNEDQDKLEATILAFNNFQLQQKDKTVLTYWETPAGSPPALRAWFWPGDQYGQEFAYPKEMAEKLAAQNKTRVASYETTAALNPEQAKDLQVRDTPPEQSAAAAPTAAPAPAPEPQQIAQAAPPREEPVSRAPTVTQSPPAPAADNTLLAQNTPPPSPATPDTEPTELPQTASPMPWVLAIGLVSLLSAAALKVTNRA